jgi:hypothetical protein
MTNTHIDIDQLHVMFIKEGARQAFAFKSNHSHLAAGKLQIVRLREYLRFMQKMELGRSRGHIWRKVEF